MEREREGGGKGGKGEIGRREGWKGREGGGEGGKGGR